MKKIINTTLAPPAAGPYSQAVRVENLLFVAGQIAIDPRTGKIAETEIRSQTKQIMANIHAILMEAGMDFGNVVKTTIYLTSIDDFAAVNEVYGSYFKESPPARETVEISRLSGIAKIEISVIAAV